MANLHATPVAVMMPHGVDTMIDPPLISSHSRQPEWLRRHAPSDFIPPPLLSSTALNASRENYTGYPTSCVTGIRLEDVCLLLSAAGPARDLISLTQIPLSSTFNQTSPAAVINRRNNNGNITGYSTAINGASLAELASSGYRPWYTRANAPLLQLVLNFPSPPGWSRISSSAFSSRNGAETPILAARSASSVEFWKLENDRQQSYTEDEEEEEKEKEKEEEEDDERNGIDRPAINNSNRNKTRWKLREESLGIVHLLSPSPSPLDTSSKSSTIGSTTTADVAWCHHMTTKCTVLCRNGMLLDISLEDGPTSTRTSTTSTRNINNKKKSILQAPVGWAPNQQLLSDLPFLETLPPPSSSTTTNSNSFISLHCAFTDNHPRHVVVSLHSRLGYVDLRSGGGGGGGGGSSNVTSSLYSGVTKCYRSGFAQEIYKCPAGQWISALATPCFNNLSSASVSSSASSSSSHYVAASTATEILLFDLRRPHAVVASWEHSMPAEGKVKDVSALYAAPPDFLTWLPPVANSDKLDGNRRRDDVIGVGTGGRRPAAAAGGASTSAAAAAASSSPPSVEKSLNYKYQLFASNSSQGKAVVCEWSEHRSRGGISAAKKGKLWEHSLSKMMKKNKNRKKDNGGGGGGDGVFEDEEEDEDNEDDDEFGKVEFSFNPACWTKIKPDQPPKLLFNLKIGYPTSLAAAVEKGKDIQRHRAMILASNGGKRTRTTTTITSEAEERTGEEAIERGEREENIALQQHQHQHQQQHNNKQRVVRLLPSESSTGPAFLGISVIPLQHGWNTSKTGTSVSAHTTTARAPVTAPAAVDRGRGSGDGGSKGLEALIAMLSPTQEIILAELSVDKSTRASPAAVPAAHAAPAVLQILNPVEPERIAERIDPGAVEEIRLDSQGRIMENPQITLAKDAAAGAPAMMIQPTAIVGTATTAAASLKISTYPQFKVKQAFYVGLSLHKWMLEEAIQQYEMSSEEYQAKFPFPPSEDDEETDEASSLKNKIQSLKVLTTSARVPFTASEAWTMLTSPTSQERNSTLLQGVIPSISGTSKKKKTAQASGSGGGSGSRSTAARNEVVSPQQIFTAALTRAGVIPLPPHIRAIPERESNSTGLAAIQSRAPFFPQSSSLTSLIMEHSTEDRIDTDGGGDAEMEGEVPSTLHTSLLKYKKQQLKAFAPALSNRITSADEAQAGSSQDQFSREIGVQPPEIVSEVDGKGYNVVFTPVVLGSGEEHEVLMHVSVAGKPPSAAAQAILDELQQAWTSVE